MPKVGPNDHYKRIAKASGIPAPVEETKAVNLSEEATEAPKPNSVCCPPQAAAQEGGQGR